MATTPSDRNVARGIEDVAIARVLDHLHRERRRGSNHFPLTEVSEATAMDPTTVEEVLTFLEDAGPFVVERANVRETAWHVRGSPYDLDGWESDAWNVPR